MALQLILQSKLIITFMRGISITLIGALLVMAIVQTGCFTAGGYFLGKSIDDDDTTYSVMGRTNLSAFHGKKLEFLAGQDSIYQGKFIGIVNDTFAGDPAAIRRTYLAEGLSHVGHREDEHMPILTDKNVHDILYTQSRGSNRYIFAGIGFLVDVSLLALAVGLSNSFGSMHYLSFGR